MKRLPRSIMTAGRPRGNQRPTLHTLIGMLPVLLVPLLCWRAQASITWRVFQVTDFPPGSPSGDRLIGTPDINDFREIVYDFEVDGVLQIYSTLRGQLTDSSSWFRADIARINNMGDVVFRAFTAEQGSQGNPQIYQLDGTHVDLGPNFIAANDLDINDHEEVVGWGLNPANVENLYSSTRGFLFGNSFGGTPITLRNNGQVVSSGGVAITPDFDYASIPGLPPGTGHLFSLNNQGDVVYTTQQKEVFMWDGTDHHLVHASSTNISMARINDLRDIVFSESIDGVHGIHQIMLASIAVTFDLDVRPFAGGNRLNLNQRHLPVAVYSSTESDATTIDVDTLLLGDPLLASNGIPPRRSRLRDVNGDGLQDLLMLFSMQELIDDAAIALSSRELHLTGTTVGGQPIAAADMVRVVQRMSAVGIPEPPSAVLCTVLIGVFFTREWRRRTVVRRTTPSRFATTCGPIYLSRH